MVFRNNALKTALSSDAAVKAAEVPETVFLLFLESTDTVDASLGFWERTLNTLIKTMQPNPVLMHVELFIPAIQKGDEVHFSTYLGRHAGWGTDFGGAKQAKGFYLGTNGSRWRAVPVISTKAIERVRAACQDEALCSTAYSLLGYAFSAPPLRAVAAVRDNAVGAPAHCAALTSRVLTRAIKTLNLPQSDAWYGPSTLFLELTKKARMTSYDDYINETRPAVLSLPETDEITLARTALLSGTDEEVERLSTNSCNMAVAEQSRLLIKEQATNKDPVRVVSLEKGLAQMLLRWSCLQNSEEW